jgi:excisionase family DNA binding protein
MYLSSLILTAAGFAGLVVVFRRWQQSRQARIWDRSSFLLQIHVARDKWSPYPLSNPEDRDSDRGADLLRPRAGTAYPERPWSLRLPGASRAPEGAAVVEIGRDERAAIETPADPAAPALPPGEAGDGAFAPFAIEPAGIHPPEWMTVRDICYETRLSSSFVRKQLQAGAMQYAVFGSRVRVRRRDYDAWVEACERRKAVLG